MQKGNYFEVVSENVNNKYTINRYYLVMDGKKVKLDSDNLKLFKEVLKKFPYVIGPNGSKIFNQFEEIITVFLALEKKERLKNVKRKKVNRKKSLSIRITTIGISVILLASIAGSLRVKKRDNYSKDNNSYIQNVTINNDVSLEERDKFIEKNEEDLNDNFNYEFKEKNDTSSETSDNVMVFEYESDASVDEQSLENALRYKDIFVKYGERYGVPWEILCSMAAQENGGIHNADYSEPALGIMQIERDALINHTFNVYNFETNSIEKFTITNNNDELEDLDYNIKAGVMEVADCIRVAFNVAVKEGKLAKSDGIAYGIQRYNMGGTNMAKTLEYGDEWMSYRNYINSGDNRYFEKIFDGVQKLGCDVLCFKYFDENSSEIREIKTKIINNYEKGRKK